MVKRSIKHSDHWQRIWQQQSWLISCQSATLWFSGAVRVSSTAWILNLVTRSIRWRTWTRDTNIAHSITSFGSRTQPPAASWISWWTMISCRTSLPRGLWDQPRLTTSGDFSQLPRTTWCHSKKNGLLRIRMFRQRGPCRFFEASDTMCFCFVYIRQVGQ